MPSSARASLRPISCVAIDLTLTTSVCARGPDQVGDDPVGLGGVARPVHGAAARGDVALELLEELGQAGHDVGLDVGAGVAQRLPVGHLADDGGALGADGRRGVARGCGAAGCCRAALRAASGNVSPQRSGSSGCGTSSPAMAGASGSAAPGPSVVVAARERSVGRPRKVLIGCSPRRVPARRGGRSGRLGRVLARISARCMVRTPARVRERPPPMCMRQEQSPAVRTSAPVDFTWVILSLEHRRRRLGVLDRERPAEPAAGLGLGQLDEVDAVDGAQQLQRLVADAAASAASGTSGGR